MVVDRAIACAEQHGQFTYSAVSVLEILFGLHHKDARKQLRNAEISFDENEVLVPSLEDYKTAGRIRGLARRQGNQLTSDDFLIGAVAARVRLPIATGNTDHFDSMVQAGLEIDLEDWRDEGS